MDFTDTRLLASLRPLWLAFAAAMAVASVLLAFSASGTDLMEPTHADLQGWEWILTLVVFVATWVLTAKEK